MPVSNAWILKLMLYYIPAQCKALELRLKKLAVKDERKTFLFHNGNNQAGSLYVGR